jgi:hypothetical protein
LVEDRSRLINRVTYALKEYFPQVLDWFREKHTGVFVEFVTRWPTLPAVQRAHREKPSSSGWAKPYLCRFGQRRSMNASVPRAAPTMRPSVP